MDQGMRDLIKKFRQMDDESQQNVIDRVAKRDQEGAELLRKVRQTQKRSDRIERLANEIIDEL